MAQPSSLVLMGIVIAAHGVRGAVKVKSLADPPDALLSYGPLLDEAGEPQGRAQRLSGGDLTKGVLILAFVGISDRTAAERLKGQRLYVPRAALPIPAEDEFYHVDLIGLRVEGLAGMSLGAVRAVRNFGAGDILEVETSRGIDYLPFTRAAVPKVDLTAGLILADESFLIGRPTIQDGPESADG